MNLENVVQLREAPLVSDIVGQLRAYADELERSPDDMPLTVVCIADHGFGEPKLFGWGNNPPTIAIVGLLELAKATFVHARLMSEPDYDPEDAV